MPGETAEICNNPVEIADLNDFPSMNEDFYLLSYDF